jgi:hypothetical protein
MPWFEKVMRLGLPTLSPGLDYVVGPDCSIRRGAQPNGPFDLVVVLRFLREPGFRYAIDADGDLSAVVDGSGPRPFTRLARVWLQTHEVPRFAPHRFATNARAAEFVVQLEDAGAAVYVGDTTFGVHPKDLAANPQESALHVYLPGDAARRARVLALVTRELAGERPWDLDEDGWRVVMRWR